MESGHCFSKSSSGAKYYLTGGFAPVPDEMTAFDLPVEGAIPPELQGRYFRNGPNAAHGDPGHWFLGEGMIHGVALSGGRATWYRNRYVRTESFKAGRPFIGENGVANHDVNLANINVICHARRILALDELSGPTEMTPELETVGPFDYGGRLTTVMTGHPKICPITGELHLFGYSSSPPWLTYHRADAAGKLVQSEEITVPAPTMMHDFAITEHSVVFMDLPVVFDPASTGTFPYRWRDDYQARLGIMPRGGGDGDVRWIDVEPCYVFHVLNAAEPQPGRLDIDVVRYPEVWRGNPDHWEPTTLHRWSVDVAAGTVKEKTLDDRSVEFPQVDHRRIGRPARFGYAVRYASHTEASGEGFGLGKAMVKYDLASGTVQEHSFGPGRAPTEPTFVPAGDGAAEDEGYVLTYVYDAGTDRSALEILDASDFAASPVATVKLPRRVPFGAHGGWVADTEL
jgi:carotenoid cleavage dioxygenase